MKYIPISAVPCQKMDITLSQQECVISIYQKSGLIYLDLIVSGAPVTYASLARDRVKLVRSIYKHFIGNLMFVDTQGESDPAYTGFNSRWLLIYLEDGDELY